MALVYLKDNFLIVQTLLKIKIPEKCLEILKDKKLREITFKKENEDYYAIVVYKEQTEPKRIINKDFISIDLGITNIVTAYSNKINNFQFKTKRFNEKSIDYVQSLRGHKKKFSIKWKKLNLKYKKLKRKITNQRKDYQHKVSRQVIDLCVKNNIGNLIIGNIKTKQLTKSKTSHKSLNRSTQNSGLLSRFKTFLVYKAKYAGIEARLVNEAYTSQINCLTGKREFDSSLEKREAKISDKITIDRDLNSAINIAKKWANWLSRDSFHFELNQMFVLS